MEGIPAEAGLTLEQRALAIDAPAITRQGPVCTDYAMAGHQQREVVAGTGGGDGANGRRLTQPRRHFAVAARLAQGNVARGSRAMASWSDT